jgi:hypothetical protein
MARRKAAEAEAPAGEAPSTGDVKKPVFKVGPIATDRNNAVAAAVWANELTAAEDGRKFTVHNVTVESRYRDAADGEWKAGKSFRGSALYALTYCLQRCSDFILSQRDPAAETPF